MFSRLRFSHKIRCISEVFRNQHLALRSPSICQSCAFHQTKFLGDEVSQKSTLPDTNKKPSLAPLASGKQSVLSKILGRRRPIPQPDKEWELIYKCYLLLPARSIQKLKIYQTGFTVGILTPISALTYAAGSLDSVSAGCVVVASGLASLMLYVMGTMCSRLVGQMYLSTKNPEQIKIATLTFWGGRLDTIYEIPDLPPFSALTVNPKDIYITLPVFNDEKLYLSLRYGIFRTLDDIEFVFGPVPSDWNVKLRTLEEAEAKSDELKSSNKNS